MAYFEINMDLLYPWYLIKDLNGLTHNENWPFIYPDDIIMDLQGFITDVQGLNMDLYYLLDIYNA